jgi:hypothetical protein
MDVTVGDVRLEWPGVVVAEDVSARFSDGKGTAADLTVKEVRSGLCGRRLGLRRPTVTLVQGAAGDWQPSALRGMASGLDAAKPIEDVLDAVARGLGAERGFDVANATVLCRLADGSEKPLFGGLSWRARKVAFQGHSAVVHHRATLQTRNGAPVGVDGLLTVEWLSARRCAPHRLWDLEAAAPAVPVPPGVETVPAADATGEPAAASPQPAAAEEPIATGAESSPTPQPDPEGEL